MTSLIPQSPVWSAPSGPLHLSASDVHIWRAELDRKREDVERLLSLLAADERSRADRFYFRRHKDHFIVARGTLRTLLGRYLGVEPQRLRFSYNDHGKPALIQECGGERMRFNISHSHGLALFAVTLDREIGIDLEWIRPGLINEQIPERFFSAQEVCVLRGLPMEVQDRAFFNCWTRKEAYIKAKGEGLSIPLDQFEVSLKPGQTAALLSTKGDPQEVDRWSLCELAPGPGFVGAIAAQGHNWELKCWQWSE